jgi:hypothetical protein
MEAGERRFDLPIGGIVLFFFTFYYQFVKVPPPYPFKWANWVSASYTILGIVVTILVVWLRPSRLADLDRVYVEDTSVEGNVAISPVA